MAECEHLDWLNFHMVNVWLKECVTTELNKKREREIVESFYHFTL